MPPRCRIALCSSSCVEVQTQAQAQTHLLRPTDSGARGSPRPPPARSGADCEEAWLCTLCAGCKGSWKAWRTPCGSRSCTRSQGTSSRSARHGPPRTHACTSTHARARAHSHTRTHTLGRARAICARAARHGVRHVGRRCSCRTTQTGCRKSRVPSSA
jgi:hypothetical protein